MLIYPYLQFAEEQVCIPWQEVCQVAMRYPAHAPEVLLVEQMIQMSDRIAFTVYQQGRQQLAAMKSNRGDMSHPEVAASIIRDTTMFQGYLWLCFLKGDMTAVQNRLLPLCLMVFPSVGLSWEWVYQMLEMMIEQVKTHLTPHQWDAVRPITDQLLETFMMEEPAIVTPDAKPFDPLQYQVGLQVPLQAAHFPALQYQVGLQVPLQAAHFPVERQATDQPIATPSVETLEEQPAYRVFQPSPVEETLPTQSFSPHLWSAFQ